jgi:uncharacterized protein involved in response to NO
MIGPKKRLIAALTDEALRLFFPLCAIHAAFWPLLWTWLFNLGLPLVQSMPPSIWHGHEMIYGAYGAALLGFILTAVPEWTDTERPSPRFLLCLAALWGLARVIGLFGADWASALAGLADLAWLGALVAFVMGVSLRVGAARLGGFVFWLAVLFVCEAGLRWAMFEQLIELAQTILRAALLAFAALLSLALARIAPPITNRILDPAQKTTPFRPHPGRRNLASALIVLCIGAEFAGASAAILGYLAIAAGAAFLDRVAESFVGRAFFRLEMLALSGAAALAGTGLMLMGAGRLGLSGADIAGMHILAMGGLGIGVLGVFSIAGKLHTGQDLPVSGWIGAALALALVATALRIAPAFGLAPPGPLHGLASLAWAGAFLIWLRLYWPDLSATPKNNALC